MNASPALAQERVLLAHAAASFALDLHGVRHLVIKGPIGRRLMVQPSGQSTDVDILIDPKQEAAAMQALSESGWVLLERAGRRIARHANVLLHPEFSVYLDLHSYFPGITLESGTAFDLLWAGRRPSRVAGISLPSPSIRDHLLILLLHSVRSGDYSMLKAGEALTGNADITTSSVLERARELQALDALSLHPSFWGLQLNSSFYWRLKRRGVSGIAQWVHRILSAGSFAGSLREIKAAASANPLRRGVRPSLRTLLRLGLRDARLVSEEFLAYTLRRRK